MILACRRLLVCSAAIAVVAASAAYGDPSSNAEKEREVVELRQKVALLTEALALARSEADGFRAKLAAREGRAEVVELRPGVLRRGLPAELMVLAANRKLGMIVLPVGSEHGVEYGMEFAIMRNDKAVAEARVVDVRRSIAGLMVVKGRSGLVAAPGDKCVKIRRQSSSGRGAGKRQ